MCFPLDALPPELPPDRVRLPRVAGGAGAETVVLEAADDARLAAALAECTDARGPAVIVLPDVRGLYRFYREVAERFALAGHHAIAIDYFGRTAGVEERDDDFDWMSHLAATSPETVQLDILAARDALARRVGATSFATVGFCFGGAHSFVAGTSARLGLDAVVGFYGALDAGRTGMANFPAPLREVHAMRAPVLGLFGGDDPLIPPADIAAFERGLREAGAEHEITSYPGAPHSFFDRSFVEHADASADAWQRVLGFLEPARTG